MKFSQFAILSLITYSNAINLVSHGKDANTDLAQVTEGGGNESQVDQKNVEQSDDVDKKQKRKIDRKRAKAYEKIKKLVLKQTCKEECTDKQCIKKCRDVEQNGDEEEEVTTPDDKEEEVTTPDDKEEEVSTPATCADVSYEGRTACQIGDFLWSFISGDAFADDPENENEDEDEDHGHEYDNIRATDWYGGIPRNVLGRDTRGAREKFQQLEAASREAGGSKVWQADYAQWRADRTPANRAIFEKSRQAWLQSFEPERSEYLAFVAPFEKESANQTEELKAAAQAIFKDGELSKDELKDILTKELESLKIDGAVTPILRSYQICQKYDTNANA